MKSKKLSKKLTLNKKTVAHLNGNEMTKVKGGCAPTVTPSSVYWYTKPNLPCDTELDCTWEC